MTNDTYNQQQDWIDKKDSSKYWQERFRTDDRAHETYLIIKEHLTNKKKLAVREPKRKQIQMNEIHGQIYVKPDVEFVPNRYTANWISRA